MITFRKYLIEESDSDIYPALRLALSLKTGGVHHSDIEDLESIATNKLRMGSSIDDTPDLGWASGSIIVDAAGAGKGAYIEHNDYYKSSRSYRPKWIIVDIDEFVTDLSKSSASKLSAKIADANKDIKFYWVYNGKTLTEAPVIKEPTVDELYDKIEKVYNEMKRLRELPEDDSAFAKVSQRYSFGYLMSKKETLIEKLRLYADEIWQQVETLDNRDKETPK